MCSSQIIQYKAQGHYVHGKIRWNIIELVLNQTFSESIRFEFICNLRTHATYRHNTKFDGASKVNPLLLIEVTVFINAVICVQTIPYEFSNSYCTQLDQTILFCNVTNFNQMEC